MATMIDETQATRALRELQIQARQQWVKDGQRCDLSEYIDAGMAAIAGCLARFDPHRGVPFDIYAAYRIRGEVRRAATHYRTWQHGRPSRWQAAPPRAEVVRPLRTSAEGDAVLRCRLRRLATTLPRKQAALLRDLLAGGDLGEIARTEGMVYDTLQKTYRCLLTTLKQRLTDTAASPARDIPHS